MNPDKHKMKNAPNSAAIKIQSVVTALKLKRAESKSNDTCKIKFFRERKNHSA